MALPPRLQSGLTAQDLQNFRSSPNPVAPQMQNQAAPAAPQGLLSRLGSGLKNMTKDPNFYDKLAVGLGGMTTNPNTGLIKMAQNRIQRRGELGDVNATAMATINQLTRMGEMEAANIVRANPAMAQEVLKQILQKKYRTGASNTISGIQTDPLTGQQYTVQTDPLTGKSTKVLVEGAFQETPSDKAGRENEQTLELADYDKAQEAGFRAYDQLTDLRSSTNSLREARDLVATGKAATGFIAGKSWVPAFTKESARLKQIVTSMGIKIINSATFGALSEKELALALSADIDTNLSQKEFVDLMDQKIAAQEKLYREIGYYAERLNNGRVKYSDFVTESIQNQRLFDSRNANRKAKGVKDDVWANFDKEGRSEFD